MENIEQSIKQFWESVKSNNCWSGAIIYEDWDELHEESKTDIGRIYHLAMKIGLEDL